MDDLGTEILHRSTTFLKEAIFVGNSDVLISGFEDIHTMWITAVIEKDLYTLECVCTALEVLKDFAIPYCKSLYCKTATPDLLHESVLVWSTLLTSGKRILAGWKQEDSKHSKAAQSFPPIEHQVLHLLEQSPHTFDSLCEKCAFRSTFSHEKWAELATCLRDLADMQYISGNSFVLGSKDDCFELTDAGKIYFNNLKQ